MQEVDLSSNQATELEQRIQSRPKQISACRSNLVSFENKYASETHVLTPVGKSRGQARQVLQCYVMLRQDVAFGRTQNKCRLLPYA